jgi:bifunctional DNA-binding transcriptional regulator/antitoxin component of YhaV-PrlF toxin-antitoxin module
MPRIKVESTFQNDQGCVRSRIPAAVRDHLKAGAGDSVIFEEGCEAAVQRCMGGPYFVVRLAPKEVKEPETKPEPEPVACVPFLDVVQKKIDERRGS